MTNKTNQSFHVKTWSVPGRQTGMVLIMALLMLMVLTLIGVSSMSSSSLEMKIASNMQQRNIAFQAAQSRLAFAASQDTSNPLNYLINIPDLTDESTWPVQTCNPPGCPDGADWVATADVKYSGCGKGVGNSLEAGKGFSYRTFEIKATGETVTGSSRSVQVSAILYPVKACGNETI